MAKKDIIILGIESSCDDTSAAILKNQSIISNEIAGQKVHTEYGGVVPELASRAHQENIVPVVDRAIQNAAIQKKDIDAIAFTRGPGLLGSLIVGTSFAKSLSLGLNIPMMEVNHMNGHVLAHFIEEEGKSKPTFPFLCLTVSGGHTQIVLVKGYLDMEVVGSTIDDAAGEAFDKTAKLLGLPYPGGPLIDKYAQKGNPNFYSFTHPKVKGLDYSFSGLKTNVLQFLQRSTKKEKDFVLQHLEDICASLQKTIITILFDKLIQAAEQYKIKEIAIAGGVSANSGLRKQLLLEGKQRQWNTYLPKYEYCTDNAAMIAITGHYLYKRGKFASQTASADARLKF